MSMEMEFCSRRKTKKDEVPFASKEVLGSSEPDFFMIRDFVDRLEE